MSSDEQWPVSVRIPVAWGDMDSFQHVNNVVYLRWFETARIAFFERLRMMDRMESDRIGPILAKTSCTFVRPVAYPDTVIAEASCTAVGGKSFTMAYRVRSEALGKVAAEGDGVIVMFDYANDRAVPVDDTLRAGLESLKTRANG